MTIKSDFNEALQTLELFIRNENNFNKIEEASKLIIAALKNNGKIISCGNGGSMCDAMHFAEELSGSFRHKRKAIPAIAISDPSHITCTANDFGYDYIFSRFIEAFGTEKDVLLVITTSGNSKNIIKAVRAAREKNMKIIALTGKLGGKVKDMVDIEIRSPQSEFSDRAQEIHIKIIHSIINYVENNLNFE